LRKAEFTQVHNLQGGLNAWLEAKLPVVTKASVGKSVAKKNVVNKNVVDINTEKESG
jgi:3-mercaptopyruvate sulfurtransferase SseA